MLLCRAELKPRMYSDLYNDQIDNNTVWGYLLLFKFLTLCLIKGRGKEWKGERNVRKCPISPSFYLFFNIFGFVVFCCEFQENS